ncbi:NAD-dependent epimerase/dehydratase family protein [Variovorax boronicumulans]|uniref:NAD-dependent epimerase/dehydratase family protein n=1 Tax=Variovorax boronicumulans TaxID=436515 RepID=UPI0027861427|nr:NAD-dependent epimerase/dehydratase family protein [Variovorax boronicumulans]MDQ0042401.1 UDP-glucose 4-epimerase [Variovorax boronicumulans]
MTLAWVLGARGLLGSAFCRALSREGVTQFAPTEAFQWADESKLSAQIQAAVHEFSASASGGAMRWEIYWAAGVGTMGSSAESLAPETRALILLLELLQADSRLMAMPGTLVFSSSAGAIYAACMDEVITEQSLPAPNTAYAREKLSQEELLRAFCAANSRMTMLLARISTLYGAGQATGKAQGLLTHIARSIVRGKPIGIYVPIDTIRDYISVDDAASEIISTLRELNSAPGALVKIIASERPTTIAEIISIFKRIARKSPRITTGASKTSGLYSRRVQFRSIVSRKGRIAKVRSLTVGIAQLLSAERFAHANPPGR